MIDQSLPLLPLVAAEIPALLDRMLRQEGVPTVERGRAPLGGRFVLYDSKLAAAPALAEGQAPIDVDEVRRTLGFDPWSDRDAGRTCRTFWRVGPYEAGEETAAADYGFLRRTALGALRRRVEQAGGLWARIAPFPAGYRSAFCFRFDHDDYVADDFHAVLSAIAGHEHATTHFVCGATHGPHVEALRRLDGLDVGSHGYYHHTYQGPAENRRNIARGIDVLRNAGLDPSGFAAPHGRSPAGLGDVLGELGVTHSSEFGAAFDDLPFRDARRGLWQVPIHPVCLGVVLESLDPAHAGDPQHRRAAADALADYFVGVADAKRACGEPAVLYGHPDRRLGRSPHVLRTLMEHVAAQSDVWRTDLTSLAWWFDLRDRGRWTVAESDRGWIVEADPGVELATFGEAFALELSVGDATASVRLEDARTVVRPSLLGHSTVAAAAAAGRLPRPVRREFPSGIKSHLRRWLDWERTTPVAEIDADHWRGRLKRALRRVTA